MFHPASLARNIYVGCFGDDETSLTNYGEDQQYRKPWLLYTGACFCTDHVRG